MSKLLENTYRAVNIGLVNEMAQLAHELDIDIWEVIAAAATKPFGFQAFYPGPGVGGHCIPLDPNYLAWRAREAGFATRFIDLAEQVNTGMPAYTADRIADLLNQRGLPVLGHPDPRGGPGLQARRGRRPRVPGHRRPPGTGPSRGRGAGLGPPGGPGAHRLLGFTPVDGGIPAGVPLAVILTDHAVFDYPRHRRRGAGGVRHTGAFARGAWPPTTS